MRDYEVVLKNEWGGVLKAKVVSAASPYEACMAAKAWWRTSSTHYAEVFSCDLIDG